MTNSVDFSESHLIVICTTRDTHLNIYLISTCNQMAQEDKCSLRFVERAGSIPGSELTVKHCSSIFFNISIVRIKKVLNFLKNHIKHFQT